MPVRAARRDDLGRQAIERLGIVAGVEEPAKTVLGFVLEVVVFIGKLVDRLKEPLARGLHGACEHEQ
jgi:hypothetical protein